MKHRRTAILLALLLALALTGCGSGADSGSAAVSAPSSQSQPGETGGASTSAEGADVTAAYQDRLLGDYSGEHDMAYRFSEDGKLTVATQAGDDTELTEGSWWVWQERDTVYLYTSLQGTAHPARYTFEVSEEGTLSLYDDTTGELCDLLTPYTCGVFP